MDGIRKVGKWDITKKPKSEDDTVEYIHMKLAELCPVGASETLECLAYVPVL